MNENLRAHERLEREFGEWFGCGWGGDQVVACSSGTAALHLALEALELRPGSRVFVPNYTMVAVARAVVLAGFQPVLVGCDSFGRMNLAGLASELKSRFQYSTVTVIVPHHYGLRPDLDEFFKSLQGSSVLALVVEDLAEAHGTPPHPESFAACWSFYRNKIVAGEEGGAVAFRPRTCYGIASNCRSLRSLGFGEVQDYRHRPRGHNYRLADSLAELVRSSLRSYGDNVARRKSLRDRVYAELKTSIQLEPRLPLYPLQLRDLYQPWVFPVVFQNKKGRDARWHFLRREGIAARPGFVGMSRQDEFRHLGLVVPNAIGMSEEMEDRILYLPLGGEVDADRMIELFNRPLDPPSRPYFDVPPVE